MADAAGFWRRFTAAFVDSMIVGLAPFVVGALLGLFLEWVTWILVSVAYFTYFHGRTGQTPGDAALGIRVVDVETGEAGIGYGRAATRWAVSIVSALAIAIGYVWMLWDPRRQTWHDKAAGTIPVHEPY